MERGTLDVQTILTSKMITYKQIRQWWKEKENKDKVVLGVCFVLVFFVGFGTGSYTREIRRNTLKPQANYTTPPGKKPAPTTAPVVAGQGTVAGTATASSTASCIVKGNIASTGKKVYHVQGGAFYKIVKPEECFNTEAEAVAAGFVKSSR